MDIITRLRIFLGIALDDTNLIEDDIFPQFLSNIQHEEGNAVQVIISSVTFTELNMGELLAANMIYAWTRDDISGNFVLYSDKERLANFDLVVLQKLERTGSAIIPTSKWWE